MKKIFVILIIWIFLLSSFSSISVFAITTPSKLHNASTITGTIYECEKLLDSKCHYCDDGGYIYGYSNMPDIRIKIELYLFDPIKNTTESIGVTYTDSHGFFEFNNLPCPGLYIFNLSPPKGYKVRLVGYMSNRVTLSPWINNCTAEVNLNVRKSRIRSITTLDNGKIYGYVLCRGSSLTWEGFPSVAVFLYDNPVGDPISSTTSSSDGYYEVTMLPYGTYIVKAEKDGYRCWPSTAIFLSEDNPESEWDFHMRVGKGEYMLKTIFHNVLEKILSFSLF